MYRLLYKCTWVLVTRLKRELTKVRRALAAAEDAAPAEADEDADGSNAPPEFLTTIWGVKPGLRTTTWRRHGWLPTQSFSIQRQSNRFTWVSNGFGDFIRVGSSKQSTPCHLTTYVGLSSMVLFTTIDESVYSNDFPNPELENHICKIGCMVSW